MCVYTSSSKTRGLGEILRVLSVDIELVELNGLMLNI